MFSENFESSYKLQSSNVQRVTHGENWMLRLRCPCQKWQSRDAILLLFQVPQQTQQGRWLCWTKCWKPWFCKYNFQKRFCVQRWRLGDPLNSGLGIFSLKSDFHINLFATFPVMGKMNQIFLWNVMQCLGKKQCCATWYLE